MQEWQGSLGPGEKLNTPPAEKAEETKNPGKQAAVENLENIPSASEELIAEANKQMPLIHESLRDFINIAAREKPDAIIFLDKGARIFSEPIKKYMQKMKLERIPGFLFYNDDELKKRYIHGELSRDFIEAEIAPLKDKKIFFFDETFSTGKGAASVMKIKELSGKKDIFYFAISCDDDILDLGEDENFYGIPYEDHENMIERIQEDPAFKIYQNYIPGGILFSKKAAELYVADGDFDGASKTIGIGNKNNSEKSSVPEDVRRRNHDIVKELKQIIFKAL